MPSFGRGLNKLASATAKPLAAAAAPSVTSLKREASPQPSSLSAAVAATNARGARGARGGREGRAGRSGGVVFEVGPPTDSAIMDDDSGDELSLRAQLPPPIARQASHAGNRFARTNPSSGSSAAALQKSSSTHSLGREPGHRRAAARRGVTAASAARALSKPGDCKRRQQQQEEQAEHQTVQPQKQEQQTESETVQPQKQEEQTEPETVQPQQEEEQAEHKTVQPQQQSLEKPPDMAAPPLAWQSSITPAHSQQDSQEQLTSHFLRPPPPPAAGKHPLMQRSHPHPLSQSQAAEEPAPQTPVLPRSESTCTVSSTAAMSHAQQKRSESACPISSTAAMSRAQQKLLLQRAAADAESNIAQHVGTPPPGSPLVQRHGPGWYAVHHDAEARAQEKEFDRIAREYQNVRRYKNPLGDALERVRQLETHSATPPSGSSQQQQQQQQPTTGNAGGGARSWFGISGSLGRGSAGSANPAAAGRRGGDAGGGAGADGAGGDGDAVAALLERMWRGDEPVRTNNE